MAASVKRVFAKSTIGIKDIHAMAALTTKIVQKTSFPSRVCFGSADGIGFISVLKKVVFKKNLVKGTNIIRVITMFNRVKNSLSCQIWFDEEILIGKPMTLSK